MLQPLNMATTERLVTILYLAPSLLLVADMAARLLETRRLIMLAATAVLVAVVVQDLVIQAQEQAAPAIPLWYRPRKDQTAAQGLTAPAVLRLLAVVAVLPQLVKPRQTQDKAAMAALARHRQSPAAP